MNHLLPEIQHQSFGWQFIFWLALGGFAAATVVQLWFLWGIFRRFSKFEHPAEARRQFAETKVFPPVSVVICARNEAENLRKNLPSILSQDFPEFEVLVVDDDSDDETVAVLDSFHRDFERLHIFRRVGKYRAGKKDALSDGIAAARHEHILLTDADCQPSSDQWLRSLAFCLIKNPQTDIVLGYGGYRRDDGVGFLNKWIRWETAHTALQYFSFALAGNPFMGVGRNLAWKKRAFHAVGGFDEHLHIPSGDDDLFVNAAARRNNTTICVAPQTFTFSEGKKNWRTYFRQKNRHLGSAWGYRWPHIFQLGLWSLSHTLHYLLLLFLLIFKVGMVLVFALFLMRMISVVAVYTPVLRKFQEKQLIPFIPIFDVLMAVFYLAFAPILFFSNNKSLPWT